MSETKNNSTFKDMVYPVIIILAISLVCSALLAILNGATAPVIAENTLREQQQAYLSVLPEGTTAEDLAAVDGLATPGVKGAMKTPDGAVAIMSEAPGYSGNMVSVYTAFDESGAISNIKVDASTQTVGIGSKTAAESFSSGFIGWSAETPVSAGEPVDAIGGATISSNAVFAAVNAALTCYTQEIAG